KKDQNEGLFLDHVAGIVLELPVRRDNGESFWKPFGDDEIEEVAPFRVRYPGNILSRCSKVQLRSYEGLSNGCPGERCFDGVRTDVRNLCLNGRRQYPYCQHECRNHLFQNKIVRQSCSSLRDRGKTAAEAADGPRRQGVSVTIP